ncbi:hypothetical protein BG003_011608 [Podila horticola]|nr:hypothetical protein BG003_011608 [Podila horticola]
MGIGALLDTFRLCNICALGAGILASVAATLEGGHHGLIADNVAARVTLVVAVTVVDDHRVGKPKLPDECLLMAFEYLYGDLRILRKLILVNKFCFKALVPIINQNPLPDWSNWGKSRLLRNPENGRVRIKAEKLATLYSPHSSTPSARDNLKSKPE